MKWPGTTPAPPIGQHTYQTTVDEYTFYDTQATKYRLAFTALGEIAVIGALVLAGGAFAGASPLFYKIVAGSVAIAEVLLQFFQVQNRYVGYRVAAQKHLEAMNSHNAVYRRTNDAGKALMELADLPDVRIKDVVEWAKNTMTIRVTRETEPGYLEIGAR